MNLNKFTFINFNKFTFIFLSFIFFFAFFSFAHCASAASLFLSPSSGNFNVNGTFSVSAKVNTGGVAVNAVEGTLVFDPSRLEVKSLSRSNSVFTLWPTEPSFSNSNGIISFAGGKPNPGYTGSSGTIFAISFRAKTAGDASITFSAGSVLANDGSGTNILKQMSDGSYVIKPSTTAPPPESASGQTETIETPSAPTTKSNHAPNAPKISSASHPDENKWYNKNSVQFSWSLSSDITAVSFLLNQKPDSGPGNQSDGLLNSKTYEGINEGIWYFHLKLKNNKGWGEPSHFKIQIDLTPPEPFEVQVLEGNETTDPQPVLLFNTTDNLSGISGYEIKIGDGDFFFIEHSDIAHNPFLMPYQTSGIHSILVKAIDRAGNFLSGKTELKILPPENILPKNLNELKEIPFNSWLAAIVFACLLILAIMGIIFLFYKIKRARKDLQKEITEAEESLHHSFDILRDDIREQVEELEEIKTLRELTAKEKTLKEKLIKNLDIAEKYIKKEIKDVKIKLK